MAYNYGFPATYQNPYQPQGFYGYQPQQVQPAQMSVANQAQAIQSGILWVANESEAMSYPVAPNNAVALWDSSRPAIYLKQADASGKPVIKVYDLVERSEAAKAGAVASKADADERYASKIEFDALAASVSELRKELDRKTVNKRKEVKDDDAD